MSEDKYSEKDIKDAIENVNNGMSKSEAARMYSIPRTTLMNRLNGIASSQKGRPTYLNQREVCY
jgi:hypothetical protein